MYELKLVKSRKESKRESAYSSWFQVVRITNSFQLPFDHHSQIVFNFPGSRGAMYLYTTAEKFIDPKSGQQKTLNEVSYILRQIEVDP